MASGGWTKIESVQVGDYVINMQGQSTRVEETNSVPLTNGRRMMKIQNLVVSDDHDIWVLDEDGRQRWGTHNMSWWLHEARADGDGYDIDLSQYENPVIALQYGRANQYATLKGFEEILPVYLEHNPNEIIHDICVADGSGYIVDGFVVVSSPSNPDDCNGFDWQGLNLSEIAA